jgi:GT2 family glycosyltransferase
MPQPEPQRRLAARPGMLLRALRWRVGHVRRRGAEVAARALLQLVLRLRPLRRLPRHLLMPLERALIAADAAGFDRAFYLACNPDVQEAGVDPLAHYLEFGWAEARNPSRQFEDTAYRRQAGLGPRDQVSALGHYLAVGRARGLGQPATDAAPPADDASAITEALARLDAVGRRNPGAAEVDVIVPVYRGRAETLRCLASVLEAGNETPFSLLVIDDRGPDAALRDDLARLARRGLIALVVQPENRGFVAAINRGMAENPARDVIWLNSDTEVFGDWIDRLRRVARAAEDIATVTPLTNNGTICSYPHFNADNCAPLELGWDQLDRLAARANAGRTVEAPTCVGFATYVRRSAIERIGPLDEAAFGRGYGEENDFSQRAIRAGLRNLIAGEVFVRHLGQTSFGAARPDLVAAALRVVERRHPGYHRAIDRFITADPVAPLRRALDIARLRRAASPVPSASESCRPGALSLAPSPQPGSTPVPGAVLIVTHSLGGGTQQHVEEEIARLAAQGVGAVVMTGGAADPDTARLGHPRLGALPGLAAEPLGGPGFADLLGELGVRRIELHHLADFGRDGAERIRQLVAGLGLPFSFVVHDYLAVCPRINLADASGMYCGEPAESGCRRCLMTRRSAFGAPDIRRWRESYARLLEAAEEVRVPDRDVAIRLRRYFPGLGRIAVRPHERLALPVAGGDTTRRRPGPVRIATIGAIGPIKGFDVLLDLAAEVRAGRAEAELTVIGYTRNDHAARAAGIEITGPYRNEDVQAEIARVDPDLILIPSTWPETYCYTLSHALMSGRPVAAFDIGAPASRLREAAGQGARVTLIPLALARQPGALLEALLAACAPPAAGGVAPETLAAMAGE